MPHPRFRERRFVLEPLAEIAPGMVDPVTGQTVLELLQRCPAPQADLTDDADPLLVGQVGLEHDEVPLAGLANHLAAGCPSC